MSTSLRAVGTLPSGTTLTGTVTGQWLKVSTPSRFAGRYVSTTVLRRVTSAPTPAQPAPTSLTPANPTAPTPPTPATPTAPDSSTPPPASATVTRFTLLSRASTSVRTGPGSSYGIVGTLSAGTELAGTVSGGWLKLVTPTQFAGKYVLDSELSVSAPVPPERFANQPYGCNTPLPTVTMGYTGQCALTVRYSMNHWVQRAGRDITMLRLDTNVYDTAAVDVVKEFQVASGLGQTGVVDAATWAAIARELALEPNSIVVTAPRLTTAITATAPEGAAPLKTPYGCNTRPVLKQGIDGQCVSAVQWTLNSWALRTNAPVDLLRVTGYFGPMTAANLTAFQKATGVNPSAEVDSATWRQLEAASAPAGSGAVAQVTPLVGTEPQDHQAFPTAARLSDGRLMLVYRSSTMHSPFGKNPAQNTYGRLYKVYSDDNGWSWSTPELIPIAAADIHVTDPGLAVPTSGPLAGRPVLTYFQQTFTADGRQTSARARVVVANDAAATTWGTPQDLTLGNAWSYISSPIVQVADSSFLAAGYIYSDVTPGTTTRIGSAISQQLAWDGAAFAIGASAVIAATSTSIATVAQAADPTKQVALNTTHMTEPNLLTLRDGRILALIRNDGSGQMFQAYSADGGASWSPYTLVFPGSGNPHMIMLSSGKIVVAYRMSSKAGNADAYYRTSSDGGATWSSPVSLGVHSIDEMTYATPVEYGDGRVVFVWSNESGGNSVATLESSYQQHP